MCRTLKAQYCKVSGANFIRQNTMGATAILEIEMEEPKPIQVAQIYDREQNPMNGRVYSEDGIAPTLRTPTGGLSEPKIMQICSYVPNSMCAGKIVDADGIATAVMENHGMPTAVVEPLSCAIRGRNPDCPSDRTAGINTEQRLEIGSDVANCVTTVQKDSMVIEPAILTTSPLLITKTRIRTITAWRIWSGVRKSTTATTAHVPLASKRICHKIKLFIRLQ